MHRPRPFWPTNDTSLADRLAESLLSYCPLSTLTILLLVVAGSAVTIPRPLALIGAVVAGDLGIYVLKRRRRRSR